jgi:hypothetical protein
MNRNTRSQLGLGIVLLLLGAWFIVQNNFPQVRAIMAHWDWPYTVIAVGAGLLLLGLILGSPGMAVPACIVAGIGGILLYQNRTEDWSSWSYMWTLIPGFVGVGTMLTGLLGENTRSNLLGGLKTVIVSAVLFLIFSAFFGGWKLLNNYTAAIALMSLGVIVIVMGFFRKKE